MDDNKKITLTNFITKFLLQTTSNDMTFSSYPKNISDLEINVSFGQGRPAKVPWISFTAPGMSTRKGYYPVLLFYKEENILILSYGVSEELGYKKTWPDEILKNADSSKAIPPLYGALLKNEQDVQLLERLAFMSRREAANK